eukprot:c28939_g1_i1 orf=195-1826(+)
MRKTESLSAIDEPLYVGEEEQDVLLGDGDDDTASYASSSPPASPPVRKESFQGSFTQTPVWPQSYRQSMDVYSHFGSPGVSSLSSGVTRVGSSFLSSSFRRQTKSSEKLSSLSSSLLPTKGEETPLYEEVFAEQRKYSFHTITEYGHGEPGNCSATQGTLNGINVLCGVGILSTPYALQQGGWLSLVLFAGLAIISLYTGILLRRCLDSQPGLETYPDIGQAAYGTTGRVIISVFLYMELYSACVEYLILEGDNISAVFPNASLSFNGFTLTATELFTIMTAICILPTVWLRDLSILSYLSAVGVIASVVVVLCVMWIGVVDGVGFHKSGPLLNLSTLPVSVGLYGFCYSGHSVFPNIYSSLKKPSQFPKILIASFAICTLLYGGMAVAGFTMFGEGTQSQITLNLPEQFVASKIAVWSTIINPFTKYALSITPVALSLEELLPSSDYTFKNYGFSLCVRTLLVVSTVCVALLLPFFGYVMAFVGSFLSMMLCLVFPASCFLKLVGNKASLFQKLCSIVIILIGVMCCITGTYSSVVGMINSV